MDTKGKTKMQVQTTKPDLTPPMAVLNPKRTFTTDIDAALLDRVTKKRKARRIKMCQIVEWGLRMWEAEIEKQEGKKR
jgi:hypothetical protein